MKSESVWMAASNHPRFSSPSGTVKVDVLIIGGGITGITTAHLLKEAGCTVAVVEKYQVGGGETGHTTAHLTYVTDTRLSELVSRSGKKEAFAFWEAGLYAMQQIESQVAQYDIECGLTHVPGFLFAADNTDSERESLQHDAELAVEMGFDAQFITSAPHFARPAVRFANQLKFKPLAYLYELAKKIPGKGSHIIENAGDAELDDKKREMVLSDCVIQYRSLVIATHVPIQGTRGGLEAALFQTKLAAYSTYAIEATLRKPPLAEALFWDTRDPYYYYRLDRVEEEKYSLIIGGEDHRTGQEDDTEDRYASLQKQLQNHLPDAIPKYRWSGQVLETPDGLPYIGNCGENEFLATGFSGNGITLGTFSGMLIRDLIVGNSNPWVDLFDPRRKRLSGVWDYVRENKDFPLYFLKDHLASVGTSTEKPARNHGEVVKIGGKKCAVYCDEHGKRTVLSAVCPHMGCIVHWNNAEKIWGCPCHGSRFMPTGELMGGPAETGLDTEEVP